MLPLLLLVRLCHTSDQTRSTDPARVLPPFCAARPLLQARTGGAHAPRHAQLAGPLWPPGGAAGQVPRRCPVKGDVVGDGGSSGVGARAAGLPHEQEHEEACRLPCMPLPAECWLGNALQYPCTSSLSEPLGCPLYSPPCRTLSSLRRLDLNLRGMPHSDIARALGQLPLLQSVQLRESLLSEPPMPPQLQRLSVWIQCSEEAQHLAAALPHLTALTNLTVADELSDSELEAQLQLPGLQELVQGASVLGAGAAAGVVLPPAHGAHLLQQLPGWRGAAGCRLPAGQAAAPAAAQYRLVLSAAAVPPGAADLPAVDA